MPTVCCSQLCSHRGEEVTDKELEGVYEEAKKRHCAISWRRHAPREEVTHDAC